MLLGISFSSFSSELHCMSALENECYSPTMFNPNALNAQNHHLLFIHHILVSLFMSVFVFILRQNVIQKKRMHVIQKKQFHNNNQESIKLKAQKCITCPKPLYDSCL